jgi:hypothetical protein
MVMLLKVLRHELLFYGGMLAGTAQMDTVNKVGTHLMHAQVGCQHNLCVWNARHD